jgi:ATP-binding cassette, subfamily B, bacterial
MFTTKQRTSIPGTPFAFLWYVTKPFWLVACVVLVLIAMSAALTQSQSLLVKWIVEAIELHNVHQAYVYGALYPVLIFVAQMLSRLGSLLCGMFWFPQTRRYTNDVLVDYTMNHSHSYFADRFAGALLTKINNVLGAIETLVIDFVWSYFTLFISLLVALCYIYSVDTLSAVIFTVLIGLIIGFNRLMLKRKRALSREAAAAGSAMRGSIVDVFSNMSAVRQYSASITEKNNLSTQSRTWMDLNIKNWLHSELTQAVNVTILFACLGGMFYWLVGRWEQGEISSAQFVFVIAIVGQLTANLIFIGRMMVNAAKVMGEMEEGLKEIVVPHDIVDAKDATKLVVETGRIDIMGLQFAYKGNTVFSNFSLHIPAGQRLGVVGHSGAGKSTLVSLLLRQHELQAGTIRIDGQDIAAVTQDSLRAAIAVVPQEPALFHRTIRENIVYGKPGASDIEVEEVAKLAYAHDFIMSLPEGYDTMVGERGVKLSGGQKQRIAIARAMLKNAPILILDEATSALDSESEVEIQKALHTLMRGKTVLAIAHRLSTLREMDRLIVLEEGLIVEDGTHDSLVAFGGTYARLWAHQAGGFVAE